MCAHMMMFFRSRYDGPRNDLENLTLVYQVIDIAGKKQGLSPPCSRGFSEYVLEMDGCS